MLKRAWILAICLLSAVGARAQVATPTAISANRFLEYTVATLPTTLPAGRIALVTDAATLGDCTVGGGSLLSLCRYSGLAWASANGASSGGALGVVTVTSINKLTLTQPASGATLTLANGKTLTVSNTLTLAGTDGTTMTFPATSATLARTDAANTFTGVQTMTSPVLITPTLGAAAATSIAIGGGTAITKVLTATATLNFGNLAALGCEDLTVTVTGAVDGDTAYVAALNASYPTATSTYTAFVSAADTVTIRYCALVSGDPASATFRATILHF